MAFYGVDDGGAVSVGMRASYGLATNCTNRLNEPIPPLIIVDMIFSYSVGLTQGGFT